MGLNYSTLRRLAVASGSQAVADHIDTIVDAAESDIDTLEGVSTTRTVKVTVDASAGGEAQTTAIATLAAGSILHEVIAVCTVAFDGDTTTTLEVGITGNVDKYIDLAEFDASSEDDYQAMTGGGSNDQGTAEYCLAETAIIATWTNTADAEAGSVDVYVTYTPPIS